jgi:hypothetical protein
VSEAFDDVIRDFIEIVNQQVGAYMDALAGFAGHHARVDLQVHRANRPIASRTDSTGIPVIVWASYEDPSKPDVVHNRIIRASDYLASNASGGSNEQQHARAIMVFLFTYWEDEIRPRLAAATGAALNDIQAPAMGDLRILRNVILHSRGIIRPDKHASLTVLRDLFVVDEPIVLSYETMHKIFVLVKQDCARLLFDWLGITDAPIQPEEMIDVAIQKLRRRQDGPN